MGATLASQDKIVSGFTALVDETVEFLLEDSLPNNAAGRGALSGIFQPVNGKAVCIFDLAPSQMVPHAEHFRALEDVSAVSDVRCQRFILIESVEHLACEFVTDDAVGCKPALTYHILSFRPLKVRSLPAFFHLEFIF